MDSRVGGLVPIQSAYVSASDIRHERRRYMSKSQRACDLCRVRKSACRTDRHEVSCRLCTAQGSQCTFNSGPIRKSGRSFPRDDGRHQLEGGTANTAVSEHATNSNAAGLIEFNETGPVPHLARNGVSNFEFNFDTSNGWSALTDQLFGDALLFTPEILMPADLSQDLANLRGHETGANNSSDSNLDLGLQLSFWNDSLLSTE
jgi:Fungal Zn(2)-Cys(6) binuclear cluster domain